MDCGLDEESLSSVPQVLPTHGKDDHVERTIILRRHPGPSRNEPMRRRMSRQGSSSSPLSFGLLSTALVASLALMAAACSSSNSTTTPTTTTATVAIPTTPAPASSASAADLSGTWSGHYSGAFSGTFTLTWQQAGSTLSGTIKLSSGERPTSINGAVTGNTIRFGTVGSTAITYSGTVSGTSMSGTYTIKTGTGSAGGPWSANKTS